MKYYSMKEIPDKTAKALKKDCNISFKDAVNIARYIRGMKLQKAKEVLNEVIDKKRPVPYFRYLDSVSHRKSMGPGRYPVKATLHFLQLLEAVDANAEFKGLDTDNLKIISINANKGAMLKRYSPKAYGRAGANNRDLVHLTVIVQEEEE